MIEKIYFDMDGVLADFDGGVTKLCGLSPLAQGEHRSKEEDDLMWEKIREVGRFYDKLDPMSIVKIAIFNFLNNRESIIWLKL